MKILFVLLNTGENFLKNPLAETSSFAHTFNAWVEVFIGICGVFLIGMLAFSVLKFTFLVTPEKKDAARNQIVSFGVLFTILVAQKVIEDIAKQYVDLSTAKIIAGCIFVIMMIIFYHFFVKKVEITSPFKLHE